MSESLRKDLCNRLEGGNTMTSRIKERLGALPDELFIAREQAYEAFKEHRDVERTLEEEEALFLHQHKPVGKNAEERKLAATVALMQDGNILHYRHHVRSTADALEDRKRDVKKLEDEMSTLGRLVQIISSENIRDAAGTPSATGAGVSIGINRTLGAPF